MEAKFARKLHRFIPSPRAAKRLSNIYRILKAGQPGSRRAGTEYQPEMPHRHFREDALKSAAAFGCLGAVALVLIDREDSFA